MRKKLVVLVCAGMLACALPALAWADEGTEPAVDGDVAPAAETAEASIEPRQAHAMGESSEVYVETKASELGILATNDWVDDSLSDIPTYRVVAERATKKIDFGIMLTDEYADCNKLEVHVKPSDTSAGVAKIFEVTRSANDTSFNFTSEIFNIGDQVGDTSYNADFVIAFVPSKTDAGVSEESQEPGAGESVAVSSGIDTGARSPKTGLDFGGIAGASLGMLVGAGGIGFALRKKLVK